MKKVIALLCFVSLFSLVSGREITFFPSTGEIAKECLVATEIIIDTENTEISATDIIIESSLDFVDFVPTDMFPYFLPPKVMTGLTHIVGFTIDPQDRTRGKGSIGTLYMKQNNTHDTDGSLRLYFKKRGDTTDTNLSVAGGIDSLDSVGSAYYTFVDSGACLHTSAEEIEGGIADISLDQALKKISGKRGNLFWKSLLAFTGLLIIVILLFVYYKGTKKGKNK